MHAKEKLHDAERKLFFGAPRFAQYIRNGEFDKASTLMAGVAGAFSSLAFLKETSFSAVYSELTGVLDHLDVAWNAVDQGVGDLALKAYGEMVQVMPDAHHRVEAVLMGAQIDGDPGTRGNDKEQLMALAERAASVLGVA